MYAHFDQKQGTYKKLTFDPTLYEKVVSIQRKEFISTYWTVDALWNLGKPKCAIGPQLKNFELAYYTFIMMLTDVQAAFTRLGFWMESQVADLYRWRIQCQCDFLRDASQKASRFLNIIQVTSQMGSALERQCD